MERDRSPAMTTTLETPGTRRSPDGLAGGGCSFAWKSWAVAPCGGEAAGVSEQTAAPSELVPRPSRDGRLDEPRSASRRRPAAAPPSRRRVRCPLGCIRDGQAGASADRPRRRGCRRAERPRRRPRRRSAVGTRPAGRAAPGRPAREAQDPERACDRRDPGSEWDVARRIDRPLLRLKRRLAFPLHGRGEQHGTLEPAPRRGARALRGGRGFHRLDRGGVLAPRPRDARPRQSLRGRAGRREGDGARAESRRGADRLRGRDQGREAGVVRRRPGCDRGPSGPSWRHSSSGSGSRSARRARTRGRTGGTSASSTRPTTAETTSCSSTSSGATTPSGSTPTLRSGAQTARCASPPRSATGCRSSSPCPRARRSTKASTRGSTPPARRCSRVPSRAAACPIPCSPGTSMRSTCASSTRPARSTSTPSCGGACARTSRSPPSRSGSATRSPTSARRSPSRR